MIIQCPSCQARYNYDESRFAGAPTKKIRCTRCTTIFQIQNPAAPPPKADAPPAHPAPQQPPGEARPAGLPGPDDFALDETALTEASKRKRAMPGAPARVGPLVPAPPLLASSAPEATAPPPGFSRPDTTDRAAAVEAAGHERRLRLPVGHRYSLACIAGPEAGRIFEIAKPRVVIGRAQADIVIGDIQCSRQHAAIEVLDDKVYLVDLNSTNGTWVGEERVTRVEIENRAEFEIGTTTLMLIRSATEHGAG
ncbi:MAG: FHA domain-containing protein [Acidobacteriota bacterium]